MALKVLPFASPTGHLVEQGEAAVALVVPGGLSLSVIEVPPLPSRFALTPEGELRIILDDSADVQGKEDLVASFFRGELDPASLGGMSGTIAPACSSIAFGGEDLKTVYLGSLAGSRIATFRSPVAGQPMHHWNAI